MKILLVHNSYRERGGEDVVFEQERDLLRETGHEVIEYRRSNSEFEADSLVQQIKIAARTVWAFDSRAAFTSLLAQHRPDIVHVHNTFQVISPSIYSACTAARIPVVQTLHNYRLMCPAGQFIRTGNVCEKCLGSRFSISGVRYGCYRNSRSQTAVVSTMLGLHKLLGTWTDTISAYIVLTEFARSKFIAGGLPERKLYLKPNFTADTGTGPGDGSYCLFVGRLAAEKGISTLLDAWEQIPDVRLKIAGSGPMESTVRARAQKMPNVEVLGFRSRAEIDGLAGAADALIVPSLAYEALPCVIPEAYRKGTPAIVANRGALALLVKDQVTGLHFRPGDPSDLREKVQWMQSHKPEWTWMRSQARQEYENTYTPDRNYALLMSIYEAARSSL